MQYLNDWCDVKKQEWISRMQAQGNTQEIDQLENNKHDYEAQYNNLQPYERKLIPNYDQIIQEIKDIMGDQQANIQPGTINNKRKLNNIDEEFKSADPFSKYKEHERE